MKTTASNDTDNDINDLFIEATATKRAHERKVSTTTKAVKKIKVRGTLDMARDDYKKSRKLHQERIKTLKAEIKKHKLLMQQAKTAYKLVKLSSK